MTRLWTLLLACAAPADDSAVTFDPELSEAIQSALDEGRRSVDAPGVALAVSVPGEPLGLFASGEADLATDLPVTPDMVFRVGSITKTFVTAAVMLEVEAGAIDLDARIDTWLPDAPYASEITLRQCLNHRSGLSDYVDSLTFLGQLDREWAPEELLDLVGDEPLLFAPDTDYFYSNANYIIAGRVLEEVTGRGYAEGVRAQLIDPLGLETTFLPSVDAITAAEARGYLGSGSDAADVTDGLHPSGAWAAGEMVADASDMIDWARAYFGGEVLSEASLAEVMTPYSTGIPEGDYGLGCYLKGVSGYATVGHSGSTYGYEAQLRYAETEEGPIIVAVLVNNFLSEADVIDAAVWEILAAR